ncbi:MAG: Uma2 family endonuclease [Burkholderiales bacterium]|nr:Uma2 family endonuclease [Anaerolineae bacterium]
MAVAPTITTAGMTIEDFIRRYDSVGPFELIEGEIIPVSPTVLGHNVCTRTVLLVVHDHAVKHNLGEAFSEAPFVLEYTSNWVTGSRVPDVMFVSAARMTAYKQQTPDWASKPLILVPDLVVEVVSPGDKYSEVEEKVARYLDDGVKLIWVVNPQTQTVNVYTLGNSQFTRLTAADMLDGGDVLPEFKLAIKDIFVS